MAKAPVDALLTLLMRGTGGRATSATGIAAEIRGFLQTRGIGGTAGAAKVKKIVALLQDPFATQSQIAGAIGKNMQWSQIPANLRGQFSAAMEHGHTIGFKDFVDKNAPKELRARLKAKANQATIPQMRSTATKIQDLRSHQREALRGTKAASTAADAAEVKLRREAGVKLGKELHAATGKARAGAAAAAKTAARTRATAAAAPKGFFGRLLKGLGGSAKAGAGAGAAGAGAAATGAGAEAGAGAAAGALTGGAKMKAFLKAVLSGNTAAIDSAWGKAGAWGSGILLKYIAPYLILRQVLESNITAPAQERLQESQMKVQQQMRQAQTPGAFQSTQQMINEALMPLQAQRTQAAFQGVMQTPGAGADLTWE